eukprot:TRINITY_DN6095_c0_g1_i2.p1 TRINITY_DN6095_c0_g1~~TRINITY_DN6095_c0_g1_i2.p1  ORF type:complete len:314 (-),score=23.81 TRINITY_DN6095_c0_g1_i2:100-1041(-)
MRRLYTTLNHQPSEKVQSFVITLANKRSVKEHSEWYNLTPQDFVNHQLHQDDRIILSGRKLMKEYHTPSHLLMSVLGGTFYPWKFRKTPANFWKSIDNRRSYIEWLGKELKLSDRYDDSSRSWNLLTSKDIVIHHGKGLLSYYKGSFAKLREELFPVFGGGNSNGGDDDGNKPWYYRKVPSKFWQSHENQMEYLNWIKEKLQISKVDDLDRLTIDALKKYNGSSLLSSAGGLGAIKQMMFPTIKHSNRNFKNRNEIDGVLSEQFIEWFVQKNGIKRFSEWCNIPTNDFRRYIGRKLMDSHQNLYFYLKVLNRW